MNMTVIIIALGLAITPVITVIVITFIIRAVAFCFGARDDREK